MEPAVIPQPSIRAICNELGGRKGTATDDKGTTLCPVHENEKSSPSLSVWIKDDYINVKCHTGCDREAVMDAIEARGFPIRAWNSSLKPTKKYNGWSLKLDDLYDEDGLEYGEHYAYHDENNEILFVVVRLIDRLTFEKQFKAAKPWKSGWKKGKKDIRDVLYRLPKILKAVKDGATIYVVEGEKDVRTLESLGLIATTNPWGGKRWHDMFSGVLKDAKRIVLFSDNDWVGYERNKVIANSLLKFGVRPEVIPPVGVEGGDVTDYLLPFPEDMRLEVLQELEKAAGDWTKDIQNPWPPPAQKKAQAAGQQPAPPKDPDDLGSVVDSSKVVPIKKGAAVRHDDPEYYTDSGNANRFTERFAGDVVYSASKWWIYKDGIFEQSNSTATQLAKSIARELLDAQPVGNVSHQQHTLFFQKSIQVAGCANTLKSAQDIPEMRAEPDDFDADKYKICVKNGVLDLKTLDLHPHSQKFRCTRKANATYDFKNTECPLWEAFMETICSGDEELYTFLQRIAGLCMTGDMGPQKVFMFHGGGSNGKSTWINTIKNILGTYSGSASTNAFMNSPIANHLDSVAKLPGARMVACGEISSNARLSEDKIKKWTGGEEQEARFMRGDPFYFLPQGKLIYTTQHLPKIVDMDYGIWRRMLCVPFLHKFEGESLVANFHDLLKEEYDAILYWMAVGAYEFFSEGGGHKGLAIPKSVVERTDEYKDMMDVIGCFMLEALTMEGSAYADELYTEYKSWCKSRGHSALSYVAFCMRLNDRSEVQKISRSRNRAEYSGVSIPRLPRYGLTTPYD